MIGGRPPIDLDADAIFAAAEETGTALEVNGALPRLDLPVDWLRRARGRNITFVLDSDSHHADEFERLGYAKLNCERAWLDPARVINVQPRETLLAWLKKGKPASA
jgi:DNA polymerase (family 10)